MSDPLVLRSTDGAVLTLTLNRPKALNSFTQAMHVELMAALDAAASDSQVRALVLTGSGRGFCAGQDLSDPLVAPEPGAGAKDMEAVVMGLYKPLVQRLRSMPVPVLAAVNGVAAGAGANLALCCDLVLAARSASFVQAFSKIGLVPDAGGTWLLPRLVGRANAMALCMLGEKLPAEAAQRMGLIWRCVDDDALTAEAAQLARQLAGMPVKALVATRAALDDAQALSMDEALDVEARLQGQLARANDYQEGVTAFFARRSPVFSDR